jgi:DNA-binding transcriptional ArsR family regulator
LPWSVSDSDRRLTNISPPIGVLIAEKLGVSPPSLSEHMRILTAAGLVRAKRIKGWTTYKRDDKAITAAKKAIRDHV